MSTRQRRRSSRLRRFVAWASLSLAGWFSASTTLLADRPDIGRVKEEPTAPSPSDRFAPLGDWSLRSPLGPRANTARLTDDEPVTAPLTEELVETADVVDAALNETTEVMTEANAELPYGMAAPPAAPAKNPAATAYKGVFYDNDFRYLNKPGATNDYLGDYLKQHALGDCWMVDGGGEFRWRYHNEQGLRGTNLSGRNDNFNLYRTRLYVNAVYSNWLRFYGEAIDAQESDENYPARPIEVNRWDALNLFADALLTDTGDGKIWIRGGRQELLYGDQRLISPLDWANTRRTFDGVKLFHRGTEWDVDAFWTRPVSLLQHLPNDHNFDHPNLDQNFYGLYSTYKGIKDQTFDFYYLGFDDTTPADLVAQTFGSRWKAKHGLWWTDFEGGYQFGSDRNRNLSAGFAVAGIGREMPDVWSKPTLWTYFDWASGDRDPLDNSAQRFNQLFPLVHKYFGFCDLVARENIQDLNFLWTSKPHEKLNFLAWWHIFWLDQSRDALYNASGAPIRFDPTGAAGRYVGQELDFTLQYVYNPRIDILLGYSHFFAGSFVQATNPAGVSGNVDFTYVQASWKF